MLLGLYLPRSEIGFPFCRLAPKQYKTHPLTRKDILAVQALASGSGSNSIRYLFNPDFASQLTLSSLIGITHTMEINDAVASLPERIESRMCSLSKNKYSSIASLAGLSNRIFWLVLIVASLTGRLYSQPPNRHSIGGFNLFACNVCDADLHQESLDAALNGQVSALSSSSLFPDKGTGVWDSDFRAQLFASEAPVEDQLFSPMSRFVEPPGLSLWPQDEQKPEEGQDKKTAHNPSADTGSPGHIFWVIPAFKVDYAKEFEPLTPKEKFQEWAQSSYDPMGLTVGAFEAGTLEYSSTDGFCGYGMGMAGYGKCFGSLELDATDSSFIGDFVLPVVLHQDPRYFRLGKGSFGKRVWYAVSRVFVTYNDSGRTVFYSSALSGTVIAAGLSNFYYPSQDVGMSHTMSRIAIDLGNTALYNLAAEFWPDIDHKIHRAL